MFSKLRRVMLGLSIALLLTSCATVQEENTAQRACTPVRTVVPTTLTMQCKEPSLKGSTISDLVRHIVELRESVDECNNRMSTIDKSLEEYDRRYNRDTEISGYANTK